MMDSLAKLLGRRSNSRNRINNVREKFHLKLKHVLGGVSLLSLLAAFEVFSIPAASGIIDLFGLSKLTAGEIWVTTAILSGGLAMIFDAEEKINRHTLLQ